MNCTVVSQMTRWMPIFLLFIVLAGQVWSQHEPSDSTQKLLLFHNPDTRASKRTVVIVGDLVKIRLVNVLKYHTVRVTALTDTSLSCMGGENQGTITWPLSRISEIKVKHHEHKKVASVGDLVQIKLANYTKYHTALITAITDSSLTCQGGKNLESFTWPVSLISEVNVISDKHVKAVVAVVKSLDGHTSRGYLYRSGDSFIDLTRPEVKTLSETESDSLLRINIESVSSITFGAGGGIVVVSFVTGLFLGALIGASVGEALAAPCTDVFVCVPPEAFAGFLIGSIVGGVVGIEVASTSNWTYLIDGGLENFSKVRKRLKRFELAEEIER